MAGDDGHLRDALPHRASTDDADGCRFVQNAHLKPP